VEKCYSDLENCFFPVLMYVMCNKTPVSYAQELFESNIEVCYLDSGVFAFHNSQVKRQAFVWVDGS
jgi:hypothetical protein